MSKKIQLPSPDSNKNVPITQTRPRSKRSKSYSPPPKQTKLATTTGRMPSKFDFEAEEGRRRAAIRIKRKRQEMRARELHKKQLENSKKQERWNARDQRVKHLANKLCFHCISSDIVITTLFYLKYFLLDKRILGSTICTQVSKCD